MKDKIIGIFKKKSMLEVLAATVNFFLQRLFGVRVVGVSSIASNSVARKVFRNVVCGIQVMGIFFEPMPSVDELNNYYSSLYWESRNGKAYGVNIRDLVHYSLLKEYIPQELVNEKIF